LRDDRWLRRGKTRIEDMEMAVTGIGRGPWRAGGISLPALKRQNKNPEIL
jgi:hypothetical protein